MQDMKKIALITGANKGIGFEIARQLGIQGIVVLIGARNRMSGNDAVEILRAKEVDASFVNIDVTKQSTITAAASFIEETYGKLDILVNNAGIAPQESKVPPSELTIDTLRETYETNVFGVFAVTKAMLPLLRRSDAGRIVNISSAMGSLSLRSDPTSRFANMAPLLAYNSSKTALNAMTVLFASELRNSHIKVNAVTPGHVATGMTNHGGMLTPEQGAKVPVAFATLPADGPTGGFFGANGAISW